jgi:hypothetical protein
MEVQSMVQINFQQPFFMESFITVEVINVLEA